MVAGPRNQNFQFPGQNGDNRATKRGRSASRRKSKRSAFVLLAHFQSSTQFLVRHVQVALRLLNARVSESQLNDANMECIIVDKTLVTLSVTIAF
jgi:hypothetical protein